ncbi:MAG: helix-turn-helix transcriptional regulator [Bacteroidales bacterium]|nr:helix-turn-helix transcriptional regulator [Bacteroidales bacterium]
MEQFTFERLPYFDLSSLSYRELTVLQLASCGCSNQQIAKRMKLSVAMIKMIRSQLYEKYKVHSIVPICVNAALQGFLTY